MKESTVEAYLRDEVKKIGGKAYKFVSPGNPGVPDRLVVIPGHPDFFVETKAQGKKSTKLQLLKQNELVRMGRTVYSNVRTKEAVKYILADQQWIGCPSKLIDCGQIGQEAAK